MVTCVTWRLRRRVIQYVKITPNTVTPRGKSASDPCPGLLHLSWYPSPLSCSAGECLPCGPVQFLTCPLEITIQLAHWRLKSSDHKMTDKIEYAQIDDSAEDYGEARQNPKQRQRRWISLLTSFFLGLTTMAAILALSSAFTTTKSSHARKMPDAPNGSDPTTGLPLSWSHGDCGNSPEHAVARGCRYSIVLHAWLPKSCLAEADEEDTRSMYKDSEWYYESASGRNLTMEELHAGDYEYFTTTIDWHFTHCMYVWKRLHRVMLDPSQELDSYTASDHHTNHCVHMIGGHPESKESTETKVFVKYPKCAK